VPFLTTSDGIALAVFDEELPSPRARIVIVHGYAEHSGRYTELVQRLMPHKFECHRFDLRGHGHSGGVPAHVSSFGLYIDDLRLVIRHVVETRSAHVPLLIIAHSLGGLITLESIRTQPESCDGVVVSSPFLKPAFEIPMLKKLVAWGASRIAPTLPFSNTLDPSWLSTDREVVESYATDPLVQRTTTPRWFTEVEHAQKTVQEHADEIRSPLLMLLGGDDQVADHLLAQQVFASIGSADKTIKTYEGLRHEVLNELARDTVVNDLVIWLQAHS